MIVPRRPTGSRSARWRSERPRYRRSRARRSTLVALVSTLVFAAALVLVWPARRAGRGCRRPSSTRRRPGQSLPAVLAGLWLNLRVLVVAEIGILVLGLLIAFLRTLRGPVFFPVRALATGYVDLFRGVPLLIALYLIGFGVPALRLQGVPTDVAVLGTVDADPDLLGVRGRGVPRRDRVGAPLAAGRRALARAHPPPVDAAGGAAAGGPPGAAAAAQRLRGAAEGLRADLGARRGRRGPRRADRAWRARFNFTPYVVAGLLFVLLAIPTGPGRRRARPRRIGTAGRGCADRPPVLEVRGLVKRYGAATVLDGIDLDRRRAPGVTLIGAVRLGQVDPAALRRPAGGHRRRADPARRRRRLRPARRRRRGPAPDGDRVPVATTCSRT